MIHRYANLHQYAYQRRFDVSRVISEAAAVEREDTMMKSTGVEWRQHTHSNGEKYWLNVHTRETRSTRPLNMAHLTSHDLDDSFW
jgi:hypothetical protein